jgi:hypothetical protein
VKCHQYASIGGNFMVTVKQCIGREAYDEDVDLAWRHIFSETFAVLLPIAVELELDVDEGRKETSKEDT